MHNSIYKQSGVALITAMLVVAIASIAAISMTSRQQLDIRRTENILHTEQAYLYVLAGELWASSALKEDLNEDNKQGDPTDHQDEDWATKITSPIDNGMLSGHLEDLQGKFNLNNLKDKQASGTTPPTGQQQPSIDFTYFGDLLDTLNLPKEIAQRVKDWIDEDSIRSDPDGAEDTHYLSQEDPYLAGNTEMATLSELLLIKDIDDKIYNKLKQFVTVLPTRTKINVNTAPAEVIAAMSKDIEISDAQDIIDDHRPESVKGDFITRLKLPPLTQQQSIDDLIALRSDFFLLQSDIQIGSKQLKHSSIIERGNTGKIYIVGRERGTY